MSEETTALTVFENDVFGKVQVIDREGEPWFVAKDVAEALGYEKAAQAYQLHCKSPELLSCLDSRQLGILDSNPRGTYIINESDLYRLVIRSKKPEAAAFSDWVMEEVIPSIRKTGTYSILNRTKAPDNDLDWMKKQLKAATEIAEIFGLEGNMALLAANNLVKNTYNTDCLKQMEITHLASPTNTQYMTPSELGSQVNMTAQKLNKKLEELGLQKQARTENNKLKWLVTEKGKGFCQLLDTNKRHSNGTPVLQIKWSTDILTDVLGEIP